MTKLISIIVPVYNAGKYLSETLNSVEEQTYKNWECLIIDDGSTDSSESIATEYRKSDTRFKYFYQENAGPSTARNFGVEKSNGEYIQFLDADDVILPTFLKTMLSESLDSNNNIIHYSGITIGNQEDIYTTKPFRKKTNLGRDIGFKEMYKNFGKDVLFNPGCILFPQKALENTVWNDKLSHSEDWDYYLQITKNGFSFRNVPYELLIYRNTEGSLSKNTNKTIEANYQILSKWIGKHYITFSKRCALLYKWNIFLFLLKKTDKIIHPHSILKNIPSKLFIFKLLIYPFTIYFISFELLKILFKKIAVGSK